MHHIQEPVLTLPEQAFFTLYGMQDSNADTYFSGLSGLQLPIPKYSYPPSFENASRLTYYSSLFNSIEFNSSFYKIPQAKTVAKWAASVPDSFRFTFKLWKGITHNKGLLFNKEDISTFFNSINAVQDKKGCLLIQFPPSLGRECIVQLESLLDLIAEINSPPDWKVAIEFRNTTWYHEKVYDIVDSYNATIVIQDIPRSATPLLNQTADFVYIRFHGPTGNYRDSYSNEFLNEYSIYIAEWLEEGKTVYAYFNNTMGDAFLNLKTLNDQLTEKINNAKL